MLTVFKIISPFSDSVAGIKDSTTTPSLNVSPHYPVKNVAPFWLTVASGCFLRHLVMLGDLNLITHYMTGRV